MIGICQSIVIAICNAFEDWGLGNTIIEVGKNYDVISVLHSALMEARRHDPVNSIFLDAFCFLVLSKLRLQFRLRKVNDKMVLKYQ